MDEQKYLILIKGQDKTTEVTSFEFQDKSCNIVYQKSVKVYRYQSNHVQILKMKRKINPCDVVFSVHGKALSPISEILDFEEFYRVVDSNGKSALYACDDVNMRRNCLVDEHSKSIFGYFKDTANEIGLVAENGQNILAWQYEKIQAVSDETVLANFLEPKKALETHQPLDTIIYPFGLNKSQKTAVEKALSSKISIIQGPPGTGKTQTILNVIANVVLRGHTLAVVSNNNSATHNVIEKMEKKNVDFLAAFLGSRSNKEQFIRGQTGCYPDISAWEVLPEQREQLSVEIKELSQKLDKMFEAKNRVAEIEKELLQLKPECYYFEDYYSSCNQMPDDTLKGLSSRQILALLMEYEQSAEKGDKIGLLKKLTVLFEFGLNRTVLKVFSESPHAAIPYMKRKFYEVKKKELQNEKLQLEKELKAYAFEEVMQTLTDKSLKFFYAQLYQKYGGKSGRNVFESRDFMRVPDEFSREYPVILSTTYSIKSALCKDYIFDYIIVDEASQVDLATAVLAFSCAKNIVIVGDLQQLPNVITEKDFQICERIWNQYSLPEIYHYTSQNLLSAATLAWPEAPTTLLREHYRCHPKIIGFCNQKFYNNNLIIMTTDHEESGAITLYRTVSGNHARNHKNQRQIDVIMEEVLPALKAKGFESIGIIAPYREQVKALREQIKDGIQIDTVHKYQGREKDAVILTSVDNVISDFVDDPRMLNVAVSRAIKSLTVITSNDIRNEETNYGDLIRYIEYNNCTIVDSKIRSVFDLLYHDYAEQRKAFLKKHNHISEYDSENLLYAEIESILQNQEFQLVGCAAHVALAEIIRDYSAFDADESIYARNPLTHVDFLLYRTLDKTPLLAIEVDGVAFHAPESAQGERDRKKNHIFEECGIPLLRIRTDESGERERIDGELRKIMNLN